MFRFSVRDLLWATTVTALAIGWWVQSSRSKVLEIEQREAMGHARRVRVVLDSSMRRCLELESRERRGWEGLYVNYDVDYGILKESITSGTTNPFHEPPPLRGPPPQPRCCPFCGKPDPKFSSTFAAPGKSPIVDYKCEACGYLFKVDEMTEPEPPESKPKG